MRVRNRSRVNAKFQPMQDVRDKEDKDAFGDVWYGPKLFSYPLRSDNLMHCNIFFIVVERDRGSVTEDEAEFACPKLVFHSDVYGSKEKVYSECAFSLWDKETGEQKPYPKNTDGIPKYLAGTARVTGAINTQEAQSEF